MEKCLGWCDLEQIEELEDVSKFSKEMCTACETVCEMRRGKGVKGAA